MGDLVGRTIAGYRIAERLHEGASNTYRGLPAAWHIYRGHGPGGVRAIVTFASPPVDVAPELAFEGIAPLLASSTMLDGELPGHVVIEREPPGWRIGDLKWPLPVEEVITVGLDLARVLQRMQAAGQVHGALRPQLTWIDRIGDRSVMSGTTPRPELVGRHIDGTSPFAAEPFDGDDDVARLGMMLLRMTTGRANQRAWPTGGARMRAVEDLATSARTIDAFVQGLERLTSA